MEMNIFLCIHLFLIAVSLIVLIVLLIMGLVEPELPEKICISMIAISLFLVIFLPVFLFIGIQKCEKSEWVVSDEPYATEKIAALNDNNLTNGKFYLRSGRFEEDLYYQYMVELSDDGFATNKVKASNVTLYYDTDNYRVEWYTKSKKWLYFEEKETYCKIFVPEGSITDEYSIDLN